jgi:hypothetical protein
VNGVGWHAEEEVVVLGVTWHRLLCVREEGLRLLRRGEFFYGQSIWNQPLEIRVFRGQQSGGS